MTHYVNESHTNWDLCLNKLVSEYNTSKLNTTQEIIQIILRKRSNPSD